jgi:putative hydrolase of the HAD superfamily
MADKPTTLHTTEERRALRAVTFDLGGTLVEYENVAWEELETAGWRGMHAHLVAGQRFAGPPDDFAGAMMAVSASRWQRAEQTYQSAHLRDIFEEGMGALGHPLPEPHEFEELAERFHAATLDLVSVYDDALETLAWLKQRGVKLALISNTVWPGELHTRDLRRFGLDEFFDTLTYSSETPHTKPHPSIFTQTLERLGGVSPAAAAHVGDRIVDDVQGAQRAGMKGILKAHPRRVDAPGIQPDARINYLADLPSALERLFVIGTADERR